MSYLLAPPGFVREREPYRPLLTEEEALAIQRGAARYGGREWRECGGCGGSGKGKKRYAMCWECQGSGVVEEEDEEAA